MNLFIYAEYVIKKEKKSKRRWGNLLCVIWPIWFIGLDRKFEQKIKICLNFCTENTAAKKV